MNQKIAFLTTIFPMKIEYLYDFFDSLEKQTYQDFDIIVINDGHKNFDSIKIKYQNLNIVELLYSNTIAKNREYGINYVKDNNYDILIFGDSDDYFSENRIEKSIELLENYDIVVNDLSLFKNSVVYCNKYISNRVDNGSIIKSSFIEEKNIFGMTNTAIKLDKIEKVLFQSDMVAVDWVFYKNCLRKGLKAIFTNIIISYYRQYDSNTVGLKYENQKFYLWWEKR